MSLQSEFQTLLNSQPTGTGQSVSVSCQGQTLACDLSAIDSLACSVTRLALSSPKLSQLSLIQLQTIAGQLASRLTYLLEPISPIEHDADSCSLQLRSMPPQKDDQGTSYYELLLRRDGELSLVRYNRVAGASRQVIPALLTRQVLVRLVGDLAAVA
jgi:hypothetical protein